MVFSDIPQSLNVILTLFYMTVFGISRPFHLSDIWDSGFALLTGRLRVMERTAIWRWMKSCPKAVVQRFYQLTRPLEGFRGKSLWISIDEHVVARWTRKYPLAGTKHPTRGKAMKADKLFYIFELTKRRLLGLKSAPGKTTLARVVLSLVRELIALTRSECIRVILDAGGCKGSMIARLKNIPGVIYLIRAKRYSNLVEDWNRTVQQTGYIEYEDPTDPKKERTIKIAETKTKVPGLKEEERTVIVLDEKAQKEKDRFYPLYTNDPVGNRLDLVIEYRRRQNHELAYRVMTHDLNLDALPKSYPINGRSNKPRFMSKAIHLIGWVKALTFNLISDFKEELDEKYHTMTIGTIVRKFISRPAILKIRRNELVVVFDYFKEQEALRDYCHKINMQEVRISWLQNRILKFEFKTCSELFEHARMRKKLMLRL